ncbi:hypothetical protein ACROYT_G019088 [Oculina patagonica]
MKKDPNDCNIPRWNYKNQVRLLKCVFRGNGKQHSKISVLRLENGCNILMNCQFVDNFAAYGVFIAESSTSLELVNTSFEQTQNWMKTTTGFYLLNSDAVRGFIYYASSGPIKLKNTTLTVERIQDIDAYFVVSGSSTAYVDNSSVIQCPIGTLKNKSNFSHHHFVSDDACPNGLYKAFSQSFIFSCKRCSTGFYSVEPLAKKCLPCPFGGNCTSLVNIKPVETCGLVNIKPVETCGLVNIKPVETCGFLCTLILLYYVIPGGN